MDAQAIPPGNHLAILELLAGLTALTASHLRSKLEKIKANKGNVNKIMLQQTAFTTELSYASSCHTYFSDSVFLFRRAFTSFLIFLHFLRWLQFHTSCGKKYFLLNVHHYLLG